jgi:hypothetical protein
MESFDRFVELIEMLEPLKKRVLLLYLLMYLR